jgi:hypothetical protein
MDPKAGDTIIFEGKEWGVHCKTLFLVRKQISVARLPEGLVVEIDAKAIVDLDANIDDEITIGEARYNVRGAAYLIVMKAAPIKGDQMQLEMRTVTHQDLNGKKKRKRAA